MKRKPPEERRARMEFYNTLTDKQLAQLPDSELEFLSVSASLRLPSDRQKILQRKMEAKLRKLRVVRREWKLEIETVIKSLSDGDLDLHRAEIEMYLATGISVDKLRDMHGPEFIAYAKAELKRRQPKPDQDTARKSRGLQLWNDGHKWSDVAEQLDGTPEYWRSVQQEIRRYATAKKLFIREGTPGAKRLT
jgi:hypothetical protein